MAYVLSKASIFVACTLSPCTGEKFLGNSSLGCGIFRVSPCAGMYSAVLRHALNSRSKQTNVGTSLSALRVLTLRPHIVHPSPRSGAVTGRGWMLHVLAMIFQAEYRNFCGGTWWIVVYFTGGRYELSSSSSSTLTVVAVVLW